MKSTRILLAVAVAMLCLLTGCASPLVGPGSALAPFEQQLDRDIQGAIEVARINYPERAAVREAIFNQLKACRAAIAAATPKPLAEPIGPITLAEIAEEAAASGVPARVKALCLPVPPVLFPKL